LASVTIVADSGEPAVAATVGGAGAPPDGGAAITPIDQSAPANFCRSLPNGPASSRHTNVNEKVRRLPVPSPNGR